MECARHGATMPQVRFTILHVAWELHIVKLDLVRAYCIYIGPNVALFASSLAKRGPIRFLGLFSLCDLRLSQQLPKAWAQERESRQGVKSPDS